MTRIRRFLVLVTAALMLTSALPYMAVASDTATVNVSAIVLGTCSFNTSSATMDFGSLNPLTGSNSSANASLQFKCTLGTLYSITDDKGLHETGTTFRMQHASDNTQLIPYTFTYTNSGVGLGNLFPITLNITGGVLATDYQNAKEGSYSDTVTLTVTP